MDTLIDATALKDSLEEEQRRWEREFIEQITEFSREIHELAISKGWWEEEVTPTTIASHAAMATGELCGEFLQEIRTGGVERIGDDGKPRGPATEAGDAILRILDLCAAAGYDIGEAILRKHEYNKTRPYKHGGKTV